MNKDLNIVFAGTPDFAATILQALLATHKISAVYTQPDRPAGRGRKLTASPVKQLAIEHHIPVQQPLSLKTAEAQQTLADYQPDIMIVVAYGLLLPQAVLNIPRHGCLNVHASLLPRWRGAAPIQRAIEAGDKQTGVTIMQMDKGLDTGDMLLSKTCDITDNDTSQRLHDKLAKLGTEALIETLNNLDHLQPQQQDDALSTYANKLAKSEAKIDWQQAAATIQQRLRAFTPWPGCYTPIDGGNLKIHQAEVIDQSYDATPGTITAINKQGVDVATGKGILRITHCQLPGSKALSVADILNAKPHFLSVGDIL